MSVRFETDDPLAIVTIDRPEVRNAVDGDTAAALAAAFRRFDADEQARIAILTGAGGTFCAGADLKAIAAGRGNRVTRDGDGPMGPTRMQLGKPVIAVNVATYWHALRTNGIVDRKSGFGRLMWEC